MNDSLRYPSRALAARPLALAALEGSTPLTGKRFAPGATVWVGSNSGNDLVIPERFELTSYKLISEGSVLHVLPPLHVQAWVWLGEEPVELKGYIRELRRTRPDLPERLPLASERFIIRYATGISLIGRFAEGEAEAH